MIKKIVLNNTRKVKVNNYINIGELYDYEVNFMFIYTQIDILKRMNNYSILMVDLNGLQIEI